MSVLALAHGAVRTGDAARPLARVWSRLPLKRIVQFTLIALVIVPIPSDDGPVRSSVATPRTATMKTAATVLLARVSGLGDQR